jgi:CheY-like chemotaxis protein
MTIKKALIVDDSRLAQFVLKKMLVAQDMEVDTSESAEEALGYLTQHKPDVIFLDHSMPGMNGLEALKAIKGNPDTAPIPIMMYTSQEDSNYMSRARELGALEVLPKQLKPAELEQALTRLYGSDTNKQSITEAANEPIVNKQKLELLVMDAEAALDQESIQHKLQQKIEQQAEAFEKEITLLNEKINSLLPSTDTSAVKHHFWNNILWASIYAITLLIFVSIYFQQKTTIQQLSQTPTNTVIQDKETDSKLRSALNNTRPIETTSPTINPTATSNAEDLIALESMVNTNNQIPFDELLLGETALTSLSELIPSLQAINFTGRVNVLANDGSFCVITNSSGQFELAADDSLASQCQLTEPSTRLADIASIDLLRLITTSNQSAESNFVITINPLGTTQPLENYPDISDDLSASSWNSIASKNRRIEIKLVETK